MDKMAGLGTALPERPSKKSEKTPKQDPDDDADDPDFEAGISEADLMKALAGNREGLVSALQDKLSGLVGKSSGLIEFLPPKIKRRVEALQSIQGEHDELEEQFQKEKAELEAKYAKLYEPLYVKRADLVKGTTDVEHPEVEEVPEAGDAAEAAAAGDDEPGVPEFWLRAMKNHQLLTEQITERDEGPLKHLLDIKTDKDLEEGEKGFRLHFYFSENPYFTNSSLTKTYYMVDEEDPILERAEGSEIHWNAGKNTTVKVMKKKPRKGSRNTKPITKTEQCESFFNFFSPPTVPGEDEEIDDDEAERLQEVMEADYEIGAILRERIVPRAVAWYTGEAIEDDDEEDDEDDEGDEDDDEEDDEDDDDEDAEEEAPITKAGKGKGSKSNKNQAADGEQPPECKQQ